MTSAEAVRCVKAHKKPTLDAIAPALCYSSGDALSRALKREGLDWEEIRLRAAHEVLYSDGF